MPNLNVVAREAKGTLLAIIKVPNFGRNIVDAVRLHSCRDLNVGWLDPTTRAQPINVCFISFLLWYLQRLLL